MPVILPVKGIAPQIPESCFLAPNATVVGDVVMGEACSVWFNAVIRGDVNSIRMGNKVNIQDGACIHATYQKTKVNLGNNVSVGHNAIVHGCTVADNVLIGMGAIVMDNVEIGSNTIIAARCGSARKHGCSGRLHLCGGAGKKSERHQHRADQRRDRKDSQ